MCFTVNFPFTLHYSACLVVREEITTQWSKMFDNRWSHMYKVKKICSAHLLLLCNVLTVASYLWLESLLVHCAKKKKRCHWESRMQCHPTQCTDAEFIEKSEKQSQLIFNQKDYFSPPLILCLWHTRTDKNVWVTGHNSVVRNTAGVSVCSTDCCVYSNTHTHFWPWCGLVRNMNFGT